MLTVNIDFQDRLVNGQFGNTMYIAGNPQGISKIYLKFDDTGAGVMLLLQLLYHQILNMNADIFGKQNSWMPIEKTKVDIKIKLSKSSSPIFKRIQYPLMLA